MSIAEINEVEADYLRLRGVERTIYLMALPVEKLIIWAIRFIAKNERTKNEAIKIAETLQSVIGSGHGSVEIIIKDGKILDVIKTIRERIS